MSITIVLVAPVLPCPTSLNVIPTAEVLDAGGVTLAYESDGSHQPYDAGHTMYTFTQFGIGRRAEAGIDFSDIGGDSAETLNAKILLREESGKLPAVALGVLNIGRDSDPGYYLVGKKSFGVTGVHAGLQGQKGTYWGMIGAIVEASKSVSLILDWQTGTGQGHTAGISWQATSELGLTLYYARNNTAQLRETDDYVGLYVGYSFNCGK